MATMVLVVVGLALALLGTIFLAAPRWISELTLGAVAPPDREVFPPDWYVRTTAMSGVFKIATGGLVIAVGIGVFG